MATASIENLLHENNQLKERIALLEAALQTEKQTEKMLRDSEAVYRSILKASPDAIVITDLKGCIRMASCSAYTMFGYKEDDAWIGHLITEFISTEDRERAKSNIALMHEQGPSGPGEYLGIRCDGSVFDFEVNGEFIRDEDEKPTGMVFVIRNVTDRKKIEAAHREIEENFHTMVNNAPDGILVHSKGRFLFVNPALAKIVGVQRPEELIGTEVIKWAAPEYQEAIRDRIRFQQETGLIAIPMEQEYFREDGTRVYVETAAVAIRFQGQNAHLVFIRDNTLRKHAEKALRESEERFRLTFYTSPDSININRLEDGLYIDINEGFTRLTGYTREEVIGKTSLELSIWNTPEDRFEIVKMLNKTGYCENVEKLFRKKDGSLATGLFSGRIISIQGVPHIISVTRDISERKQAEQALRESEELYRSILKASPDSITITDLDGCIQMASPKAVKLFGYTKEDEVVGRSILEFVPPKDHDRVLSHISLVLQGVLTAPNEYHGLRANGSMFDIESNGEVIRDANGQPTRIVIITRDISERKRAEQALRESEELFRTLIEGAPDAIFVQTDGLFAYLNPAACHLWGAESPSMLLGRLIVDRVHPSNKDSAIERTRYVNEIGKPLSPIEHIHIRLDGTEVPVEVSAVPIVFSGKNGALVFVRDISKRKEAEKKLRESEALFQSITKASPDIITITDLDGRLRMVSNSALTMLGYNENQNALGIRITDFLVPEDRERAKANIIRRFQGTLTGPSEYHGVRANGSVFDVEANVEVIRDNDGQPTGLVIITRDITERKKADLALRESERNYREIFNATNEPIFLHDAITGSVLDVNDPVLRVFGFETKDEIVGRNIGELSVSIKEHPYNKEEALQRIRSAVEEGPQVFEWLSRKKTGELIWLEVSLRSSQIGGEGRVLAVVRDISERKQAEQALRVSERNYREIFNATSEAIILYDAATGQMIDANDTKATMYGYNSKEDVLKLNLSDFSSNEPPYTKNEAAQWMRMAVEQGPQVFEWHAKKKNGTLFWVEVSLRITQLGGEGRILAVIRDISERKHAEQEKLKLQSELVQAQKLESIGRLAGGVAHEYNNMLNVIISYAELGMYSTDPSKPIYTNLKEILAAAQRSTEITRKLLAFARKQLISPKVIDLNKTIESLIKPLRRLINENIALDWLPGADLWPVKMDSVQIDQILINLCINSRDAIIGYGKIAITTENIVVDHTYCTLHEDFTPGNYVVLTVNDNGRGMDRDTKENIFEPFFTTKEFGQGTGLGMATVYGIVKQNNGIITVLSEPEKGTTIRTYFPAVNASVKTKPEITEQIHESNGETVLVVEDEKTILDVMTKALKKFGYRTISTDSPSEALRMVKEDGIKVDLLITDVVMPEMNGLDLANLLQTVDPFIKILYMSGYTSDIVTSHGVLEQDVNFIQKPFSMKEMANKIRQVLEMK